MINCGINGPESIKELGINAKMNDLQAVMGLCVCVCWMRWNRLVEIGRMLQKPVTDIRAVKFRNSEFNLA